jgi:uncharacterized protein (DUF488 family)
MPGHHPIHTIGHSTRTIEEFVDLLRIGNVELVVDIRSVPRSRTNPQFNQETLPETLVPWQIGYRHIRELGGLRSRSKSIPPKVNGFWTNPSFHNFADYALSDAFRQGLSNLMEFSETKRSAIMCSEAVWWRCHRRIVADYLLVAGWPVFHLMGAARIEPAALTPAARPQDCALVYPAA